MTTENLAASVRRLLESAELSSIGRTLNMGEIHLTAPGGSEVAIHLQCPFRLVRSGRILLGSADLNYSKDDEWAEAFDKRTTVYDTRAAQLNHLVQQSVLPVTGVELGAAGALTVSWRDDLRLEVLPNISADEESWRVFRRSGTHYGYPEHLI